MPVDSLDELSVVLEELVVDFFFVIHLDSAITDVLNINPKHKNRRRYGNKRFKGLLTRLISYPMHKFFCL